MSWLARLKHADTPTEDATKPTKPGFVGFVALTPTESEKNTGDFRARWCTAALAAGFLPDAIERMGEAELVQYRDCFDACADWYAAAQAAASMLADSADMEAGRVPRGWTAAAACQHCGPVFLAPDAVALLDACDGHPWCMGCPWCFVHLPSGHRMPRPMLAKCGAA